MPRWCRTLLPPPARWLATACLLALLAMPSQVAAQPTGTITGTITEAGTGTPLANVQVAVFLLNGGFVASAVTDASGAYSAVVPPGAAYFILARTLSSTHVSEFYPDAPCATPGCSISDSATAVHVSVAGGATVSGINLALAPAGSISGTVTNAATGAAVSGVTVFANYRIGNSTFTASTSTNGTGQYTLAGLGAGTYYLATAAATSLGLRNEIFDGTPCVGNCLSVNILAGTPTAVTAGATATGRNFALEPGGSVSGTVVNAATSAPLENVNVSAYTRVGTSTVFAGSAQTNAAGQFTIGGLATGSYYLFTSSSTTSNEIHDNILCPLSCNSTTAVESGAPVAVTLGGTTPGVNFALDPGGAISGTVTNEAGGAPLQSVSVIAVVRAGNSIFQRAAFTNAAGQYTIVGLPTGSYALFTSRNGFVNEIYDNIPCAGTSCSTVTAVNSGTPVAVTSGATTANRNFALQPAATGAGTVTGTITDAASGLPIGGLTVELWLRTGSNITGITLTSTNVAGQYTFATLPAGSYHVDTTGNHPFRNEVFDNLPCVGTFCGTTIILSGTQLAVTAGGTATANFALNSGDAITGTVTDAATGAPLTGVSVNALNVATNAFGTATTTRDGRFQIRGLLNGSYVLLTSNSLGYFNEIYDNIRCTGTCSTATAVASGTRVNITTAGAFADTAQLVSGINFALDVRNDLPAAPTNFRAVTSAGTAQFTWNAPSLFNAAAPTSYLLEAGGSPGTTFITLPIAGTGTSFAVPGVPPGTFYVRLRAVNAAGAGPASNEIVLVIGAGGTAVPDPPTNLVAFMSGELLTTTWSPALGGGPATGYILEAGSASGSSNIATINLSAATFSFTPVPAGFYFLRVRAVNAAGVSAPSPEVLLVVGNVASPPSAPTLSHSVTGSTVNLSWTAPAQGTATSYLIEAGSAPGLSNIATFNTGSTALSQSFGGVPPGVYYVRIRALNAQGASVVSNERIVTVS